MSWAEHVYGAWEPPPLPLTPVELHRVPGGPAVYLKRDDLFEVAGQRGGKARTCWHLCTTPRTPPGLVTAGSRHSPQVQLVAAMAATLGRRCHVHVPAGAETYELASAARYGAQVIGHRPGHNSVIIARAREDAARLGWREIPFGMQCPAAVEQTAPQVANLPPDCTRLVVPVGSGMTLCGILEGLARLERGALPITAVVVGADPARRLHTYAPFAGWWPSLEFVRAQVPYHHRAEGVYVGSVLLDPVYEAKCVPWLEPGACLWCVGIREEAPRANQP